MRPLICASVMAVSLFSCKGPGGDKAEVSQAKETATASASAIEYRVDTANSLVTWVGSKPAGRHNGIINLSGGSLSVEGGEVTAGEFTMDMSTVQATDEAMDADKNAQLTDHLRSSDFFDVEHYPASTFEIVSVEDIVGHEAEEDPKLEGATHFVTGNLTMKDSTKAVRFPAIIEVGNDGVSARASFHINRTDWGMHYKSDKSFGNQIIHSRVEVGFDIRAN